MDINEITSLVGSVGFPIIMCLLMYKEIDELRGTIEANTNIITKLYERFKMEDENAGK